MSDQAQAPVLENAEAEIATLGALLLDPSSLDTVTGPGIELQAADFHHLAHQTIFASIVALRSRGEGVDLVTLSEELRATGALDRCGGGAYVSRLTSAVPTSANVEHYARIVKDRALKRAIDRAPKTAKEKVGPLAPAAELVQQIIKELPQPPAVKLTPTIARLADVFAYRDPEHLVEGLLVRNTLNILSAFPGVGKTLVAHEIERSVADGFPCFGNPAFRVNRKGPVLIFDEETPASFLKSRLKAMGFTEDLPVYIAHFCGLKVDQSRDFEIMLAIVNEIQPELIVFDSLIRFHGADENSATEMAQVMGRFRALANLTTVLLIHHTTKGLNGDLRFRSRGSGDIIGAVDCELALTPEGDKLICQSVKSRMRPIEPFELKIEDAEGRLAVSWQGRQVAEGKRVADMVRAAITGSGRGVNEILADLAAKGADVSRGTVRRALDALAGEVEIVVGARGAKTYFLPDLAGGHDLAKGLAT